ncbi:hypothetical protein PLICRDRAFT_639324 [Plicaturopsis crispa FD-325 SS-3]|uniref:Uncharacterized protein n=1 Tax=Plicaturopsis crispa FD-325 SS-3 TaxID=944288 RepID=A0A0C9SPN3_PLICR|nr:hypothetical protein PLICRDRAFT_639324 [Plicaturopsis crispa FD-325 SS-3]
MRTSVSVCDFRYTVRLARVCANAHTRHRNTRQTLIATTAAGPGSVYIDRVLRTIEDLKFMITWASKCKGDSGKVWVKKQYDGAFQNSHDHCARFEHLDEEQKKKEMTEPDVVDMLAQWKRKNEKMVTKRWQLLNGYHKLGAGILLERVWDIENSVSVTLGPVLAKFYDSLSDTNIAELHALQAETEDVLVEVCRALGGDGVGDFVYTFLQDYPSELSLSR